MHIIGRKTDKVVRWIIELNENVLKWVWLTTLKGMTTEKITSLLNKFNDIDEIYNAKEEEYRDIDLIRQRDVLNLSNKETKFAEKVIEETKKLGAYIVTYDSSDYPEKLRYIPNPPYVLYVKGELKLNDSMLCIGVVGTRDITDYGEETTRKFCFELARNGFTVVSGLAMGVDAVAASSAIMAGGNTIAVLGCGLDRDYPKPNREIRKNIEQYGAVVTEYPVGTQPLGSNFPQRNRIIAGLSECVLVTQAPKRSGALITASYAVDMGKEVFCIPASIFDSYSIGNNNLIKEGAIPVTSPQDITEIYKHQLTDFIPKETRGNMEVSKPKAKSTIKEVVEKIKEKVIKPSINDERYKNLDETQKIIMELVIEYEKLSVDEIIRKTNIAPAKIGATLSLMEMTGAIKKLPGNFYVLS